MNYLLLFKGGNPPKMDDPEGTAHMEAWTSWMKKHKIPMRVNGGMPLEMDGQVLCGRERKECEYVPVNLADAVGGYAFVNAKNMSEAKDIARECPILDVDGNVEIRGIKKMET
jgi:hypothetical protein